jgi:hypothetical protein
MTNTFTGTAYRVLPGYGFIKPDDLAGVEKFVEDNGGKWRKPDNKELFFSNFHVVGPEVRKGDSLQFTLSADPNGQFGERNVQAREVTGGSGDAASKLGAKVEKLEKDVLQLSDKTALNAKIFKLEEEVEVYRKYAEKVGVMDKKIEMLEEYAIKTGVLEHKVKVMEETFGNTVKNSVIEAMTVIRGQIEQEKAEKQLSGAKTQGVPGDVEEGQNFPDSEKGSTSEVEGNESESSRESDAPVESTKEATPSRKRRNRIGKTYNFTPTMFQAFKSSIGLGLLTLLFLICTQAIVLGSLFQCEAKVVEEGKDVLVQELHRRVVHSGVDSGSDFGFSQVGFSPAPEYDDDFMKFNVFGANKGVVGLGPNKNRTCTIVDFDKYLGVDVFLRNSFSAISGVLAFGEG